MQGNTVCGPLDFVSGDVVVLQGVKEMKTSKAPGPSDVSLKVIADSGEVGTQVIAEVCQGVLDVLGMPAESDLCIVVPIFKGKGDIRNCSC